MLEQKYEALLNIATSRRLPDTENIRLCFQTLSLAAAIDRDCAAQLAPYGLSEGRFVILFLLNAAEHGLAPNELAHQAGITRATVTGLLDGLERDALLQRLPDDTDRRALRIELTPKGHALANQVFAQHSRWIAGLFQHLSADERQQLSHLLSKAGNSLPSRTPGPHLP